jgi:hypothetical protein
MRHGDHQRHQDRGTRTETPVAPDPAPVTDRRGDHIAERGRPLGGQTGPQQVAQFVRHEHPFPSLTSKDDSGWVIGDSTARLSPTVDHGRHPTAAGFSAASVALQAAMSPFSRFDNILILSQGGTQ